MSNSPSAYIAYGIGIANTDIQDALYELGLVQGDDDVYTLLDESCMY